MTTTQIKNDQLKTTIFNILGGIAPEADFDTLDPNVNLQETLDIDSFDFLNFLIGLNDELGVEIPEADYGKLVSLNDIVNYLMVRLA
ncbi:MAG: acyl carrier protein [Ardenticatenaceae bacterium]|nr:acyl carrier protein [Ardenticatenaceae bacterium]